MVLGVLFQTRISFVHSGRFLPSSGHTGFARPACALPANTVTAASQNVASCKKRKIVFIDASPDAVIAYGSFVAFFRELIQAKVAGLPQVIDGER
jgi:hypothetical protein